MIETAPPTDLPALPGVAGTELPAATSAWKTPDNELGYLSEFIHQRDRDPLDHHIACVLREIADDHALWTGNCDAVHFDTDYPCDEYERGLHLGIAWLKARVVSVEPELPESR